MKFFNKEKQQLSDEVEITDEQLEEFVTWMQEKIDNLNQDRDNEFRDLDNQYKEHKISLINKYKEKTRRLHELLIKFKNGGIKNEIKNSEKDEHLLEIAPRQKPRTIYEDAELPRPKQPSNFDFNEQDIFGNKP